MPGLTVRRESFPTRGSFTISRGSRTAVEVVLVELAAAGRTGRGECVPYARYGESVEGVVAAIEGLRGVLEAGDLDRRGLQEALPAGAARNALDCAFWDLEAKQAGRRVWQLAGLAEPGALTTAYTLSLDTPEAMGAAAAANAGRPLLKLKLAGPEDLARVEAVRAGAPASKLVVDANEGWDAESYGRLAPELARLGVTLVEQPLPAGADEALAALPRPVPLCADESCHDRSSLPQLRGRYDMVNVKLDKTGGLTEALALVAEAEAAGFGVMVGCMLATSLAMAPATLPAQRAQVVDLDGPLLLAEDRDPPLRIDGSVIQPPAPELWG
ncbi:N-acetyl-D-Glu racemase DgcA [Algihabitans albus]|uniref:N-acetyl-D-Glu racemase DgcA n=1 Tax=Algihabitans albus TaxID=2164067 RepID=UPI000E5D7AE3|nr:N-acetyl-D-Glu racemase DgcA [Algihabitans albus]